MYRNISKEKFKKKILSVEGFSDIMADKIVRNIRTADEFIRQLGKYATYKEEKRVSDEMKGMKFVVSGFRDKQLEKSISERGGKVVGSISKSTSGLILKSRGGKGR